MGFLGQVFKGGSRFLGKATQGAAFLGRHSAKISTAAGHVSQFAGNSSVQAVASRIGVGPRALGAIQSGAGFVAGGHAALPGLRRDAAAVGNAIGQSKRSIADLYKAANA